MHIYKTLDEIAPEVAGQLVMIGNFDGLHRGHQALLKYAKEIAQERGLKTLLLTFEPHPRRLFRPDDPPFRITPYELKVEKLAEFGVDTLVSLPFDWAFASQSAEDFIRNILQKGLQAAYVVVGTDFCFGQLRKGTPDMIQKAGIEIGTLSPRNNAEGQKYSSSFVRQALRKGDIETANQVLGWKWQILGTVVKGDQRGRELGYPTANIPLKDTLHPAYGIYACHVQIEGEEVWRPAAVNIGIRPMFEVEIGQVEAHILEGFNQDIYDKKIRVQPVEKLRGEAKFENLDALIEQMEKDCNRALEILNKRKAA